MAPHKGLTRQDRAIWNRVKRTVRPLRAEAIVPESSESFSDLLGGAPPDARTPPRRDASPLAATGAAPTLADRAAKEIAPKRPDPSPADMSQDRRLRRGQAAIDARIDLHGHTQDSARRALASFIVHHRGHGARCVLVITGKGRMGEGVLRARFAEWIRQPDLAAHISGVSAAHPRHGGQGAFYVLLRRRPPSGPFP